MWDSLMALSLITITTPNDENHIGNAPYGSRYMA